MRVVQSIATVAALTLSIGAVRYGFNAHTQLTQMQSQAVENLAKSEFNKEYAEFCRDYSRLTDHLRQMLQQSRADFPEVWRDRSMVEGVGQFGAFTGKEVAEILMATYGVAKNNLTDVKSINFIENLKSTKSIAMGLDINAGNIDVLRLGHSDPAAPNYYYVSPFHSQQVDSLNSFKTMFEKMPDLHELYAPIPKSFPAEKSGIKVSVAQSYLSRGMA